jgi:hypothetical protein
MSAKKAPRKKSIAKKAAAKKTKRPSGEKQIKYISKPKVKSQNPIPKNQEENEDGEEA